MTSALVRVRKDRPAFLEVVMRGHLVTICIAAHDEGYLTARRDWKHRLKLTHPDASPTFKEVVRPAHHVTGGPNHQGAHVRRTHVARRRVGDLGAAFRRTHRAYEKWQAEEKAWYACYGLEPPT